jgi:hypothetical protein
LNRQPPNRHFSTGNPIADVLVVLVGALAIGAFIVLGVVAFVALGGILLVFAAVLGIRLWWLDKKSTKEKRKPSVVERTRPGDHAIIEGEFRDVSAEQDEKRAD